MGADERMRVGLGYDLHRLEAGRPLMLGTARIPHDRGLAGHSDGDVLCHAIADALLGASGLGEIGRLFPDTAPEWAGVSGAAILSRVSSLLADSGAVIENIDAVVIAERPRLAPHRDAMVSGIARALGIDEGGVSVKIKSNEGVDAIGGGEAIAAQAVSLVRLRSADRRAP